MARNWSPIPALHSRTGGNTAPEGSLCACNGVRFARTQCDSFGLTPLVIRLRVRGVHWYHSRKGWSVHHADIPSLHCNIVLQGCGVIPFGIRAHA